MPDKKLHLPKCLIVDDLEANLVALENLLKDEKVQIIRAQSGLDALALLLEHDFALALVDVQMPQMDGFELAEIMRSTEKTRSIPLIFVTAAGADAQRVFQGYEKGAVDFLPKPLNPHIVISKVRVFLELYNQREQLKQKLKKIEETEHYLQAALKSRDEFLSICSHELKTPLTSLKMQIQIVHRLKEKKGEEVAFAPANMEKFLSHADRSVERIIHLVNDMLDISRVATGRLSLNIEEVKLDFLVMDIAERLKPFMELAGCDLHVSIKNSITGLWDKFRVEQVLTNLLTNAAKYAPEAPVEILVYKENRFAVVEVKDRGPGISESDQKRVFERFERIANEDSVSGLGLGLYISKEIIELHHGSLTLTSKLTEGTSFYMKLPLL